MKVLFLNKYYNFKHKVDKNNLNWLKNSSRKFNPPIPNIEHRKQNNRFCNSLNFTLRLFCIATVIIIVYGPHIVSSRKCGHIVDSHSLILINDSLIDHWTLMDLTMILLNLSLSQMAYITYLNSQTICCTELPLNAT